MKDKSVPSCFTDKQIKKIASAINKLSKKNKKIDKIIIRNRTPSQIYQDIQDRITKHTSCDKEACILSLKDLMKIPEMEELKEQLKIQQPEEWKRDVKDNRWVSNWEIDDILYREDDNNDDFSYLGAVPIDFDKCSVSSDLCKFSLNKHMKKGHKRIAIVFNTGDSKGDGQHWISMFINMNDPCIYYFDSYGREPIDQVQTLIDKIVEQARKNIRMMIKHNPHKFQVSGYECGMYCIHFIKEMLKGKIFEDDLNIRINE